MHIKPPPKQTAEVSAPNMFRALSDPTRLRLLSLLKEGEQCVCHLVEVLGVSQPAASRHLAYLRKVGLVTGRKEGLWHYYRLTPARTKFHRQVLQCVSAWSEQTAECRHDLQLLKQVSCDDCC